MTLGAAVGGFTLVAAALTVVPGLDTALVLRAALTQRRRDALATGAGIVGGLLVWATAAAVGVSALLTASRFGYHALRLAGAGYLVWFGARLLWSAVRGRAVTRAVAEVAAGADPTSAWRAARRGLATNLLNPKVGVFYLALLPQFLPPGAAPVAVGLLLAAIHGALSMAWFVLLTVLAGGMRRWLRRPGATRVIDGVTGAALVGFGIRLALPAR